MPRHCEKPRKVTEAPDFTNYEDAQVKTRVEGHFHFCDKQRENMTVMNTENLRNRSLKNLSHISSIPQRRTDSTGKIITCLKMTGKS